MADDKAPPQVQYTSQPPGYNQPPPPGGYMQNQPPPPGGYVQNQPMQGYGQPQAGYGQPLAVQPGYAAPGQPMVGQPPVPGQVQWMIRPEPIMGCPPGLEYLSQIDQILVHQQVELLEVMTGFETKNKYQLKNSLGQQVYFAAEESETCHRICCGPQRGFQMHITDNLGQEVIRINRPFKCCAGCNCFACADCCSQEIEVEAPVGTVAGYVKQTQSCLAPKYSIFDTQNQEVLKIEGPVCICQGPCCTWDQEFKIFTPDGSSEVGKISKQWTGFVKEMFTGADNFGVSFPMDLDVRMKATMLGAVFLIDFMFFEQKNNNNN